MTESSPPRPSFASLMLAVGAMFIVSTAIVSLTVVAASDDDDTEVSTDAGGSPTEAVSAVELSEFAIDPDALTVGLGGDIEVTNGGSVEHNFAIEGWVPTQTMEVSSNQGTHTLYLWVMPVR